MTARYILVRTANILLAVFYIFGALVTLFPEQPTVISHEFDYISLGVLLLATGIFGSPYYVDVVE